jgi:Zn-dependent protease with chaperone function
VSKLKCTSDQADAVQLYLWKLRSALRLDHWDIYLSSKAADDNCFASINPTEGRYVAEVRVRRDFWTELDDDQKRHVLTHELLHLTHRDVTEVLRKHVHVTGYLPQRAYRMAHEAQRLAAELMVDHLTGVMAPTMPAWTGGTT